MTFGQQIQALRKDKGLSQDALAGMLYVTRQSVSQWENDKSMPSVDLLVRLSRIFEISVDELLGNNKNEDNSAADGKILKSRKDIRLSASYKFASTVSILIGVTLGFVLIYLFSSSIWEAAYQGIKYHMKFTDYIDDIIVMSFSVIISIIFVVKRIIFEKRVFSFSKQFSEDIKFYSDRFVITDTDGETAIYFFAELRKIYENDNYLYLTLPTKQCLIVDKSSLSNLETVCTLLSTHNKYHKKLIVIKRKRPISPQKARIALAANNIVFILSMVLAVCSLYIKSILMTNSAISAVNRWILFLIPFMSALLAIVLGIIEMVKKMKAMRLIISGTVCLLFLSIVFGYMAIVFPAYNFNLRAVEPEEFLSLMDDNHFTVRQANREHLEDFLWECYEATDENGIKIIYMHFNEEVKNRAAYSAKTAYEGFVTDEMNASNNSSHGNYMNLYLNNYYTHFSDNGRYCYVSQNRYTIIYITSESKNKDKISQIFADYKMELPY